VVPSDNVKLVLSRMEEKFANIQKNINLLKDLVASESANGIPENKIQ
jgi:hypothetical protein